MSLEARKTFTKICQSVGFSKEFSTMQFSIVCALSLGKIVRALEMANGARPDSKQLAPLKNPHAIDLFFNEILEEEDRLPDDDDMESCVSILSGASMEISCDVLPAGASHVPGRNLLMCRPCAVPEKSPAAHSAPAERVAGSKKASRQKRARKGPTHVSTPKIVSTLKKSKTTKQTLQNKNKNKFGESSNSRNPASLEVAGDLSGSSLASARGTCEN